MRMGPHHMMPRDTDAIRDVHLAEGTSRRVWGFARPYRATITVFLAEAPRKEQEAVSRSEETFELPWEGDQPAEPDGGR